MAIYSLSHGLLLISGINGLLGLIWLLGLITRINRLLIDDRLHLVLLSDSLALSDGLASARLCLSPAATMEVDTFIANIISLLCLYQTIAVAAEKQEKTFRATYRR